MPRGWTELDGWDGVAPVALVPTPGRLARLDRWLWRLGRGAAPGREPPRVVLTAPPPSEPVPLSELFLALFEAVRWQRLGLLPVRLAVAVDLPRCLVAPFGLPASAAPAGPGPAPAPLPCNACPAGGRTCEGLPAGVAAATSRDELRRTLAGLLRTPPLERLDGAWLQHDLGLRGAVRTLVEGGAPGAVPPGLATSAVPVALTSGSGGWLEPDATARSRLVYAGREPAEVAALAALEAEQLAGRADAAAVHARLGRAFGYPPCCVEAYLADSHAYEHAGHARWGVNPVHLDRIAARSGAFDPLLNPFVRGTRALRLIEHLPCRFDCAPSVSLARTVARELVRRAPALGPVLPRVLPGVALVLPDRDEVLFRGRLEGPHRASLERVLQPGGLAGEALFAADAIELREGPRVALLAGEQVLQTIDVAPFDLAPGLPRFVAFGRAGAD